MSLSTTKALVVRVYAGENTYYLSQRFGITLDNEVYLPLVLAIGDASLLGNFGATDGTQVGTCHVVLVNGEQNAQSGFIFDTTQAWNNRTVEIRQCTPETDTAWSTCVAYFKGIIKNFSIDNGKISFDIDAVDYRDSKTVPTQTVANYALGIGLSSNEVNPRAVDQFVPIQYGNLTDKSNGIFAKGVILSAVVGKQQVIFDNSGLYELDYMGIWDTTLQRVYIARSEALLADASIASREFELLPNNIGFRLLVDNSVTLKSPISTALEGVEEITVSDYTKIPYVDETDYSDSSDTADVSHIVLQIDSEFMLLVQRPTSNTIMVERGALNSTITTHPVTGVPVYMSGSVSGRGLLYFAERFYPKAFGNFHIESIVDGGIHLLDKNGDVVSGAVALSDIVQSGKWSNLICSSNQQNGPDDEAGVVLKFGMSTDGNTLRSGGALSLLFDVSFGAPSADGIKTHDWFLLFKDSAKAALPYNLSANNPGQRLAQISLGVYDPLNSASIVPSGANRDNSYRMESDLGDVHFAIVHGAATGDVSVPSFVSDDVNADVEEIPSMEANLIPLLPDSAHAYSYGPYTIPGTTDKHRSRYNNKLTYPFNPIVANAAFPEYYALQGYFPLQGIYASAEGAAYLFHFPLWEYSSSNVSTYYTKIGGAFNISDFSCLGKKWKFNIAASMRNPQGAETTDFLFQIMRLGVGVEFYYDMTTSSLLVGLLLGRKPKPVCQTITGTTEIYIQNPVTVIADLLTSDGVFTSEDFELSEWQAAWTYFSTAAAFTDAVIPAAAMSYGVSESDQVWRLCQRIASDFNLSLTKRENGKVGIVNLHRLQSTDVTYGYPSITPYKISVDDVLMTGTERRISIQQTGTDLLRNKIEIAYNRNNATDKYQAVYPSAGDAPEAYVLTESGHTLEQARSDYYNGSDTELLRIECFDIANANDAKRQWEWHINNKAETRFYATLTIDHEHYALNNGLSAQYKIGDVIYLDGQYQDITLNNGFLWIILDVLKKDSGRELEIHAKSVKPTLSFTSTALGQNETEENSPASTDDVENDPANTDDEYNKA